MQNQKIKLQGDYQTAHVVYTNGLYVRSLWVLRTMRDDQSLCGT